MQNRIRYGGNKKGMRSDEGEGRKASSHGAFYQESNKNMRQLLIATLLAGIIATTGCSTKISEDIESDSKTPETAPITLKEELNRLAASGKEPSVAQLKRVYKKIQADRNGATAQLLPELKNPKINELTLAEYVWALGLAEKRENIPEIIQCFKRNKSQLVKDNCLVALGTIGGDDAGDFILTQLNATTDGDQRFNLLNLLARMQYEKALPKTLALLNLDEKENWKSLMVFGKYGDKGVPLLISQINNPNEKIRAQALALLKFEAATEAKAAVQAHYWKESNSHIRHYMLYILELITPDWNETVGFSKIVITKEKDPDVLKYAKETIADTKKVKTAIDKFKAQKRVSEQEFKECYQQLYDSKGKKGDYRSLRKYSDIKDEDSLKKLRERILQRDSDEAFYDYEKVSEIIYLNRLLANTKFAE